MRSDRAVLLILVAYVGMGTTTSLDALAEDPEDGMLRAFRTQAEASRQAILAVESLSRDMSLSSTGLLRRPARLPPQLYDVGSQHSFEVLHSQASLTLDPVSGWLDAQVEIRIRSATDGLRQAVFWATALAEFEVRSTSGLALSYTSESGRITVDLPRALALGDETQLVFVNRGVPDCQPDAYWGVVTCQYSPELAFDLLSNWFPVRASLDPYAADDTGTIDLDVSLPNGLSGASGGVLLGTETKGDRQVLHFVGQFPEVAPLYAFARYHSFTTQTRAGTPVSSFLYLEPTAYGNAYAQIAAQAIDFFGGLFLPYPFAKHDLIALRPDLGVAGWGPASITFYDSRVLQQDPSVPQSENVVVHEIAHTWWGNLVRPEAQEAGWLSEGLATFSANLAGRMFHDSDVYDRIWSVVFLMFRLAVPSEKELSVASGYGGGTELARWFVYYKPAHVLRTLRWWLGDDAFFLGLRDFAASNAWSSSEPKTVSTDTFRAAMEKASGRNLWPFFDQWIARPGYPIYRWAAEFGGDPQSGYQVDVRIEQTQQRDVVYDIPLEVAVWAAGEDRPRLTTAGFNGRLAEAHIPLEHEPRLVRVDDPGWVWGDKVPALAGDVDGSNQVDGLDLVLVAWSQGSHLGSDPNYLSQADFDRNGRVDETDLQAVRKAFGRKGNLRD